MTSLNQENFELRESVLPNRAYVFIIGGKEHNVLVDSVGYHYVVGRASVNRAVMLIDRPGRGEPIVRIAVIGEEEKAIKPGESLIHSEQCVMATRCKIVIRCKKIEIVEEPWRLLLKPSSFAGDGTVIPSALCEDIPAFSKYCKDGVWAPVVSFQVPARHNPPRPIPIYPPAPGGFRPSPVKFVNDLDDDESMSSVEE